MSKEAFLQQFFALPIRFPRMLGLNEELAGKTFIGNDITAIDPSIVAMLEMNTAAPIIVTNHLKKEGFDIARAETISYVDAVRILPKRDERYMYEAGIYRPEILLPMQKTPLYEHVQEGGPILHFDIIGRVQNKRFPFMKPHLFIPWAVKAFSHYDPQFILGDWEPKSVNYTQYHRALEKGANQIEAVMETWSYRQFSESGYGEILAIHHNHDAAKMLPPGSGDYLVQALFGKSGN